MSLKSSVRSTPCNRTFTLLTLVFLTLMLCLPLTLARASSKLQANNCSITPPANLLAISSLAQPWVMGPECNENNANQSIFVQAILFNPTTKALSIYDPLVIDSGTIPAIAPVAPIADPGTLIGYFGGSNDDMTTVNGTGCDQFTGQVFYCNTQTLFAAINSANLTIPPLGNDVNGHTCPTVRSFKIVDQDQSDNVQTTYLVTPTGQTAQNTPTNRAELVNYTVIKNPSDNRVLSIAIDGAIGCTPWLLPDVTDSKNTVMQPSQAADELQAAAYQADPIALIPAGDPMVGPNNLDLVNLYRKDVDQPTAASLADANDKVYCRHMNSIQVPFLNTFHQTFINTPSPIAGFDSLYAFMINRLKASRQLLGCDDNGDKDQKQNKDQT